MWYLIAFLCSAFFALNSFLPSLFFAFFGRLYILYCIVKYHREIYFFFYYLFHNPIIIY